MTRANVRRGAQSYDVRRLPNEHVTARTVRAKKPAPVYTQDPGPWTFTVDGEPVGKGRPRFSRRGGKVRTHTPEETRRYELFFATCAKPFMPRDPIGGDLAVEFEFVVHRPLRLHSYMLNVPAANAIDTDNYIKAGMDALKHHFRDNRVAEIHAKKRYANPMEQPHARVTVRRI